MRFKHRYTFNVGNKKLEEFLTLNEIPFELKYGIGVFEVFEDDEHWEEINKNTNHYDLLSLVETIYSPKEFNNAEWLSVRSKWRWEYPQPEGKMEYRHITYNDEKLCIGCGRGLVQKDSFRLKKTPKWASKYFLMLNWVEDELFISSKAKEELQKSSLKGIHFYDVKRAKDNVSFDDVYQLHIKEKLSPGMIEDNETIASTIQCHKCGGTKFIHNGKGIKYKKSVFNKVDVDIIKSAETFGDGHMCARIILVSQEFFQFIKNNKLGRNLEFEPILLV
ncbi:hypothetical protein LRR81_18985 [Metabacillus sp. GX 13764]|uniref:hypothetical protein n=1 Tax=Metabacillus kandeliae TaxID=2900151 RepID=UPI001E500975|nr:hypothetical protein [Metabacillus kandeliae]MCD7036334.1 hypothetical protein [Metabacillus kandeliae]